MELAVEFRFGEGRNTIVRRKVRETTTKEERKKEGAVITSCRFHKEIRHVLKERKKERKTEGEREREKILLRINVKSADRVMNYQLP